MTSHPFDPPTPPTYVPPSGHPENGNASAPPPYAPPTDYAVPTQYAPAPAAQEMYPAPYGDQSYPAPYAGQPQQTSEGAKFASFSMASGIVGLLCLGFVFGPVALYLANRASRLGATPTAGKVLGWIATSFGAMQLIAMSFSMLSFHW